MKTKESTILYSCYFKETVQREQIVEEHALILVQSGIIQFLTPDGLRVFQAGEIVLLRRNQLAKTKKVPDINGNPVKSVTLFLTQDALRHYVAQMGIEKQSTPYSGNKFLRLTPNPFLEAFFLSLLPYYDHPEALNDQMTALKTREAIELLLRLGNNLHTFLFDFSEPHKIDLETFMLKNFEFNIPIMEFARLSGRSISTFKRDFQKVFTKSPEKWLRSKRLDRAYELIKEKKQKPSEIYLQVGFETLSHFSIAFKEQFGFNPSTV